MSFDLDSYSNGNLFVSFLIKAPNSQDESLYEIKNGEFGIVIYDDPNNPQKTMVLWGNSRKILKVDKKRLHHICDISP